MAGHVSTTNAAAHSVYRWIDGLVGGLVGGIAQGVVSIIGALMIGREPMWQFVLIGYAFRPMTNTPNEDLAFIGLGLAIHTLFTIVAGLVFVLIAPHLRDSVPLVVWSIFYAELLWLVGQLGALALVDPTMAALMNPVLVVMTHLAYGLVLGWWLAFGGHMIFQG